MRLWVTTFLLLVGFGVMEEAWSRDVHADTTKRPPAQAVTVLTVEGMT